jgi:hypothetical protein
MMTRRMFAGVAAGGFISRECLVLEAVAAEKMPHRLVVSGVERAPFFEVRDYGSAGVAEVLERKGMRAVLCEKGRFLFAFESLAERERAWRGVRLDAPLREIAVYRTI